ncbi:pyruvate ferredoxin oxidoreductase [Patescibacteria group bacterium]
MNNKSTILTGSQAVAEVIRQAQADVVPVYPITPTTEIIETFAKIVAAGKTEAEFIKAESEHAVMSIAVGASTAGARVMTASASQGIALMWEVLGVASGLRLPIIMALGNRALSAPINIHCDHSDSMGTRDLGWIQIYSENVQEVYDHMLLATKLAEHRDVQLPAMIMQDGFTTTHSLENLEILPDEIVQNFVGERYVEKSSLDTEKPSTWGATQLPEYLTETALDRHEALLSVKGNFLEIGDELSKLTGRKYPLFETYPENLADTDTVIVIMNSTAGTVKVAIDKLRAKGKKVGLVKPILFRPFPYEEIREALQGMKTVYVYDRSLSYGAESPLASEIRVALSELADSPEIESHVYGLGGRDLETKHFMWLGDKQPPDNKSRHYEDS